MRALPLIFASLAAVALVPVSCTALADGPLARANYRGRRLATPLGLAIVLAALAALALAALVQRLSGVFCWRVI